MKIKRKIYAALALGMVLSLTPAASCLPFTSVTTAEAAKITQKTATIMVGSKLSLAITGTSKKAVWSSSNKKVAKVSNKGVVTAKKAGKATIKAKVGKKTYQCKVTVTGRTNSSNQTVQETFNVEEATKLVTYQGYKIGEGTSPDVIGIFKNNYDQQIDLDVDCLFYDEYGNLVGKYTDRNHCFEPGKECVLIFRNPHTFEYFESAGGYGGIDIPYSTYEFSVKITNCLYTGVSGNVEVTSNFGEGNVMVTVTNRSGSTISTTRLTVIFYKDGNVIGYDESYPDMYNGTSDYLQIRFPYDENYDTIIPDDYVIYVNHAYNHSYI